MKSPIQANRAQAPKNRRSKPKWHLIYYLLAAFDLVTVSTSLYLNHQLTNNYAQSVQINQEWAGRLQTYSELSQLAANVNAPGNDVFDSHNVALESERLNTALLLLQQNLSNAKQELQANANSADTAEILKDLEQLDSAIAAMVKEAHLIFSYFQQNKPELAGRRMATMDRKYAEVNTALAALRQHVSQVQQHNLEQQKTQALLLKNYEFAIAGAILVMVVGVTVYGHKLAQKMAADAQANEQLIEELQQTESELKQLLEKLHRTQSQMVQSEKMSALGQMVAGVAHEINNPVNFIHGNLSHVDEYTKDLLALVQTYQQHFSNPPDPVLKHLEQVELDFLTEDLTKILQSMKLGTDRIREIVLSLRNFSRLDEDGCKAVDIHEGLENTLMILNHRFKAQTERPEIQVTKNYGELPLVECYAGQLNQVFMNLLSNAIDAVEESNQGRTFEEISNKPNRIWIHTQATVDQRVIIVIQDNGVGISEEVKSRLFNPFFTTKPTGKGTGLGLSISTQIVAEKHRGKLWCDSTPGMGTKFVIELPILQAASWLDSEKAEQNLSTTSQ